MSHPHSRERRLPQRQQSKIIGHTTYTLGEIPDWSVNECPVWRIVIITSSMAAGLPKVQRLELPEQEAKRMVRVMSADLY